MSNKKQEKAKIGVDLKVEIKHYDSYEEAVQKAKEFNEKERAKAEAKKQENQSEKTQ